MSVRYGNPILVEAGSDARSYAHRSRIMRAIIRQALRLTRPRSG